MEMAGNGRGRENEEARAATYETLFHGSRITDGD